MHAIMHLLVENHLAEGYDLAVRALARMRQGGLDRHEDLHALASVLAQMIFGRMSGQDTSTSAELDRQLARGLDALTVESWQDGGLDEVLADAPDLVMPRPGPASPETERLKALLATLPAPATNLEQLDGLFAALICGPEVVSPSEYLPEVWGLEPPFENEEAFRDLFSLLMGHWNTIADELLKGLSDPEHLYLPVLIEDDQGRPRGNDWAAGFQKGVEMRRESWATLLEDPHGVGLMVPVWTLLHENDADPATRSPPIDPAQRDYLLRRLAENLAGIYRYFAPMRVAGARDNPVQFHHAGLPVRRGQKVGRNDPCPCGSGRKYKRCCGAAGAGSPTLH